MSDLRKDEARSASYERNLMEASLDSLVLLSLEGIVIDCNERAAVLGGVSRDKLLGSHCSVFFTEPQRVIEGFNLVLEKGSITNYPLTVAHPGGQFVHVLCNGSLFKDENGQRTGVLVAAHDITDRKDLEEQLRRQSMCLEALNRVYREALTCETEEQLGKTCLDVAEWLTGSKFGYIGEINEQGLQDIVAISNPGWDACTMLEGHATVRLKDMPIRGIDRATLTDGKSRIVNDNIESHPDHFAPPAGHPALNCFLGVPLKESGKTTGMIALANKEGGYTAADQEGVERLAVAIVEAFSRKRAELAVQHLNANIENLVRIRTDELNRSRSWTNLEYEVVRALAESRTLHDAMQSILTAIIANVARERGRTWGAFWGYSEEMQLLGCTEHIQVPDQSLNEFVRVSGALTFEYGCKIPGQVWKHMKATIFSCLVDDLGQLQRHEAAVDCGLTNGVAFPIYDRDHFFGVVEFLTEKVTEWDVDALEALGQQIGQYASRKLAERERERLANVVKQSSDAILTATATGQIASWNKGAEQILAFTADEVIGKNISMLLERSNDSKLGELLETSLKTGKRIDGYETSFITKYGQNMDVLLFAVPWFTNAGKYSGCSMTLHNITEKKKAERKVSEFYSMVSHELRTPLTSIRGVLGLIENRTVDPGSTEAAELIELARTSTDRLIRLINMVLDLKKIEAGKMELQKTKVEIKDLVAASLEPLQSMASGAGITIAYEGMLKGSVFADRDKAVQIITNLISNAIKFSPPNGRILLLTEPTGSSRIRFRVIDNGRGIAAHDIPRLFDKFQQLDSSDSRPADGSGLGLAITRALVEEHGGTIGVNSTVGKGSEFWFELPAFQENHETLADRRAKDVLLIEGAEKTEPETAPDEKTVRVITAGGSIDRLLCGSRKCKILIVDDDEELRKVLCAQIKAKGLECFEASNGKEALGLAQADSPDLVILDVIMPELDGFAFVSALKKDDVTSNLPMIVYSCKDLSSSERELLVLGVTRYLVKGESSEGDLLNTVVELLQLMKPLATTADQCFD